MLIIKENGNTYKPYIPSKRLDNKVKGILNNPNLDIIYLKDKNKVYLKLLGFDKLGISEINRIIPISQILGNH